MLDPAEVLYSYVLPFRDDGDGRLDNLIAVLEWLRPLERTQFLVVEQDKAPCPGMSSLPHFVDHLFLFNPGPFNKSWALNVGVNSARGEVLAIADADIVLDTRTIEACLGECREKFDAINPYSQLIDLDAEHTRTFHRRFETAEHSAQILGREHQGELLCFCGGMYIIRKCAYLKLGGQDERFVGWGGEDDAMSMKLNLLEQTATNRSGLAYHLYHKRAARRITNEADYRRNARIAYEYQRMSRTQLESLCRAHVQTMGDLHKYDSNSPVTHRTVPPK